MKKLVLLFLVGLSPIVTMARTVEVENFVIITEGEFKTVCTKDRSDCKCFIHLGSGWSEFECPKSKQQSETKK